MRDCIRLRSGTSLADISVQGAEILNWHAGQSLLWQPDKAFWAETAPVLFPVVGWTQGGQVRVAGEVYPLGLHGFARHKRFRVGCLGANFVRLILDSDAQTLGSYPFEFRFCVEYRLDAANLHISLVILNRGIADMPYACGLHPGFRWPLGVADQNDHRIVFDEEEEPSVPEITAGGFFTRRRRAVPLQGAVLALTPELFAREALCFLDASSAGLHYESKDGAYLRVETKDFPHIAFWSKPAAAFLAIELWTGYGDPEGFDGDLFAKPSMRLLPPGAEARHEARFSFSGGSGEIPV